MHEILSKVHWVPPIQFNATHEVELDNTKSPWLALSEIIPGLYLTCEERMCHRGNAQVDGVCLILTLNGEDHVSSYKVYEYNDDSKRCIYRKIPTFEDFLLQLDEYTSNEIPDNASFRKVFIRSVPAEDASSYDLSRWFPEMCLLIELVMVNRKNREALLNTRINNFTQLPSVAVHCLVGVSRSATIVVAYIMKRSCCSRDHALAIVKRRRPVVNPNPGFLKQLAHWERSGYYRVVDGFTASLFTSELRKDGDLTNLVVKQLPLILCTSNCRTEREFFGYVLNMVNLSIEDARLSYYKLRDSVISCVCDEIYVDIPMFFANVCEIVTSLSNYSPHVLNCTPDVGECFDDEIYFHILKQIGNSGAFKEHSDVAHTLCSFLESIEAKHLSNNPENKPRHISILGNSVAAVPEGLCLSFPYLPFVTLYASGFLQCSDIETCLDEEMSFADKEKVLSILLKAFRENFLLTASGTQINTTQSDVGRWHANSRFGFLKSDVEIKILEGVERGSTLTNSTKVYLMIDSSSAFVSLCWMRKIASAAVGTRFFFESVDRYFDEHYGNRFSGVSGGTLADRFAPWGEVFEVIRSADKSYEKKFSCSPDLLGWLRNELTELSLGGSVVIPE